MFSFRSGSIRVLTNALNKGSVANMTTKRNVFFLTTAVLLLSLFVTAQEPPPMPSKTKEEPAPGLPLQEQKPQTPSPVPLQLVRLELSFDSGRYYQVVRKGERQPLILCRIVTQGEGTLRGVWTVDDQVVLPLQHTVSGFQDIRLSSEKLPRLPLTDGGMHRVSLNFNENLVNSSLPVLRYFVSIEPPLSALSPESGQVLIVGEDIVLKWTAVKGEYQYQLSLSQTPFQFLSDTQIKWQNPQTEALWTLKTDSLSPGHVYWMIRAVSSTGRFVSASEINYFLLKEPPPTTDEVIK